jgi:magnesium transporter
MIEKLLQPEIRDLISNQDFATLSDVFSDWLPADLAGLVMSLPEDERPVAFRAIQGELAASTFEYLELGIQEHLLEELPKQEIAAILNGMSPDDRTALLEEVPEEIASELMTLLTTEERAVAQTLLDYPENSVGRLMTPDYIAVGRDWTVKRVLDHVRLNGKDSETLDVIYVVDENNRLIDDIRIREFLLAHLFTSVRDIMDNQYVTLTVTDDQETAVAVFRKYDRTALPVVDLNGMLVGIVTVDDVLDVVEEEATEDIQKFGGLEALDEPYVSTPLLAMVKKRATWLVILFLSEMLTATAMGFFEDEIAKAVVLALFVPLIISSGGNSGSQAATLIIRALALGEVKLRDWWMVMRREIYSGILLGLILGAIGFLRIAAWSAFSDIYGPHWILVGLTVGISLVGIVLWGTLAGSMLPFVLKRFGADPATSSAPFVATLVDVTGLLIYFTVAVLLLRGTLL